MTDETPVNVAQAQPVPAATTDVQHDPHGALLQELGALLPELRGLADYVRRVEGSIAQRIADEFAAHIERQRQD